MNVLLAPHVTEKTSLAMQNHNQYTFRVRRDATKTDISKAVELMFEVKVDGRAGGERAGQGAPLRPHHRAHPGLEEGLREPGQPARRSTTKPAPRPEDAQRWPSSSTSPHPPARAPWSRSTARTCTRAARTTPLTAHQSKTGARNHFGRITTRHIGGGSRQKYRIIDFKRDKDGITGVVERLEYDPNRTAHIALVKYADGERRYILAPKGVKAGDEVRSGADAPDQARQRHGAAPHAGRLDRAQRRDEARPRRPARAQRRRLGVSSPRARASTRTCGSSPARRARCTSTAAPPSARSATTSTTCAATARPARSAGAASARRCAASP